MYLEMYIFSCKSDLVKFYYPIPAKVFYPSCLKLVGSILLFCHRPLHLCVSTWNVAVVKRWVELASREEIADAIDIESPLGTSLCMAAALKKDHEVGKSRVYQQNFISVLNFVLIQVLWLHMLCCLP